MKSFSKKFFEIEEIRTNSGIARNEMVGRRKINEGVRKLKKEIKRSSKLVFTGILFALTVIGTVILFQHKGKSI